MGTYYFAMMKLPPDARRTLAHNIGALLARSDMSQQGLATRAGLGQKTISNLMDPDGPQPTLKTINAVAAALGLTVDQLFFQGLLEDPESAQRMRALV